LFKYWRVHAFSFQAWRLRPGGRISVDYTFFKEVIEQEPNGCQVLPLGSEGTRVALEPEAEMIGFDPIELQLILRAKFEE
jgi:hypothetical protein